MMTKHTPGPWDAQLYHERQDGGRFSCFVTSGNQIVPIAAVPTGVEGFGREEGRANARLIAAAPDLLGELQQVLSWAIVEKIALRPQEIASIRIAIARATGDE